MSNQTRFPLVTCAVALVLALAGVAAASPQLTFEPQPPVPTDTDKHPPPSMRVTVIDGPGGLAADAFALRQPDTGLLPIKASSVLRYAEGHEPLGLVVLIEGDQRYLSALPNLLSSLEGTLGSLGQAGPKGSQALVLLYAGQATPLAPAGPLDGLATVKLTPLPGAGPTVARDLAGAVKQAIAELDKLTTPRKALLVIGDGIDGAGAKAPSGAMRELAKLLQEKQITSYAIVLQPDAPALGAPPPTPVQFDPKTGDELPEDPALGAQFQAADNEWRRVKETAVGDMKALTDGNAQRLMSVSNIGTSVSAFTTLLDDRFYLLFPGYDPRTKAGLVWDGKERPLMLRIDGVDTTAVGVVMRPTWRPPGGGATWWIWLLVSGGALALVAGVVMIVKKPKPLPPPPPPVVAPPPPQAPAVRQKTMFAAMDGDAVFPMVGWVVFMNGPKRLKFVKIKQGVTKIGTGANSDVVIDDGYMSTDHAMVVMTPDGFWLQDNNSANGTFLNDNKLVKKEELGDNDLILLGKTVLKFKSVM